MVSHIIGFYIMEFVNCVMLNGLAVRSDGGRPCAFLLFFANCLRMLFPEHQSIKCGLSACKNS